MLGLIHRKMEIQFRMTDINKNHYEKTKLMIKYSP